LEVKLGFLNSNSAISFARECLRLDPKKRPNCDELMAHDYFNDFREWFEDEIQSLIEIDNIEAQQVISGLSWRSKAIPS
jgi:serine/threonine protein kinase